MTACAAEPVMLTWDAILEPDLKTHPASIRSIEPVKVGGIVLGSAKDFRWHQQGQVVLLVATLTTNRDEWTKVVGNADVPVAAFAGPYKVLRGL